MAEPTKKFNISIPVAIAEKLDEMKKRKGFNRSVLIALAVEKMWREEYETK